MHLFCFAYAYGYKLTQFGTGCVTDCQADWINNGAVGFSISGGATNTKLIGCFAYGVAGSNASNGYMIQNSDGDYF